MLLNRYFLVLIVLSSLLFVFCGKTSVSIDSSTYEPKIVFEGYLYPNMPVSKIKLSRNFPVGTTIDKEKIALKDANVVLWDLNAEQDYALTFNSESSWFEYKGDLLVEFGKTYRLTVEASIDGKDLVASSVTTVPDEGMRIVQDSSLIGDLYYRQRDSNGHVMTPFVAYDVSDNTAFYLLSISGRDASEDTFIKENLLGLTLEDAIERGNTIENFQYGANWTTPENFPCGCSKLDVNWFQVWFYGRYSLILYAGDRNFYHYYATHSDVQDIDGNLKEPVFEIDGDGIGVFGSAVVDTVYMNILRPLQ